jgi:hypothetical protein
MRKCAIMHPWERKAWIVAMDKWLWTNGYGQMQAKYNIDSALALAER